MAFRIGSVAVTYIVEGHIKNGQSLAQLWPSIWFILKLECADQKYT
jgi:hypothetical protein